MEHGSRENVHCMVPNKESNIGPEPNESTVRKLCALHMADLGLTVVNLSSETRVIPDSCQVWLK